MGYISVVLTERDWLPAEPFGLSHILSLACSMDFISLVETGSGLPGWLVGGAVPDLRVWHDIMPVRQKSCTRIRM